MEGRSSGGGGEKKKKTPGPTHNFFFFYIFIRWFSGKTLLLHFFGFNSI